MRVLLASVLLIASTQLAEARDVRALWGEGSVVSSTCIGSDGDIHAMSRQSRSIQCFVDTMVACDMLQLDQLSPDWTGPSDMSQLCDSFPPLPFHVNGQAIMRGMVDFYYSHDTWTISEEDLRITLYPIPDARDMKPGDTVLDIFILRCMPQAECVRQLPEDVPLSVARSSCPRTECRAQPALEQEYTVPDMTYFMRQNEATWETLGFYTDFGVSRMMGPWRPDHWKRK